LLRSERKQGSSAFYGRAFAYVGSIQHLKDLKDVGVLEP
jgi:hypothetical protein